LKFGACAISALWPTCADDLKHFPRGLGSASEAYCPARLGPGGAFFVFQDATFFGLSSPAISFRPTTMVTTSSVAKNPRGWVAA